MRRVVFGMVLIGPAVGLAGCNIEYDTPPSAPPAVAESPPAPAAESQRDATDAGIGAGPVDQPGAPAESAPAGAAPTEPEPPPVATSPSAGAPAGKRELLPIESTSRRAVMREEGLEVITFDDLNLGMQADMVFRDFLLNDRVRELDGQRVRLIGYIHGGVSQLKGLKEFVLLRNTECKFGPGGLAAHLVRVFMVDDAQADYTTAAVQSEGQLKVNPFQGPDGNTWSVYDLQVDKVKELRR